MEKLICNKNKTLIDAWKIINANAKGTVFIIDDNNKLSGVLTDGDIRRFLIEGGKLDSVISKVIKKDFVYATVSESRKDLLAKISYKTKIIPIVDNNFKLVDFFEYRTDFHIPVAIPDLKGNEINYLIDAFLSTWISSSGRYITKFEDEFSKYCQSKYGVAVTNGTVALLLALKTLGIGKGDEVIIPDFTFAATANAVLHAGATPVIVDVEHNSWCISPDEIEKAITKKTKAIIPVHIYGQPCNMDAIMSIAKKHNIHIIEDCAQAHGAEYDGKKIGSYGDINCFSFFGNKIITTGEGGMCITNNKKLADKMKILRDHGMSRTKKYWHDVVGYNFRMTNLQAAIGIAQLERIDEILKERKIIEEKYKEVLSNITNIQFQRDNLPKCTKVTWLVCILINKNRDELIKKLQETGIDVRPFFYSLSNMPIYKNYVFSNKNSIEISQKGLNFPTNNVVDEAILNKIKEIINKIPLEFKKRVINLIM